MYSTLTIVTREGKEIKLENVASFGTDDKSEFFVVRGASGKVIGLVRSDILYWMAEPPSFNTPNEEDTVAAE